MGNEPRLPARVLLVEDDPAIAASVARELAAAGFAVTPAGSGEDGLRLALAELPDVIVLDWMLPGIDGLETLRRLRSASRVDSRISRRLTRARTRATSSRGENGFDR